MSCAEHELVISFNGEIYNYRELRAGLELRGHQFRSNSDTEVLLRLYAEKGQQMLADLRGMFAFALWDHRRQGLFLARDHFGIKPLYYADDGKAIRVASEVKALVAGGHIDTEPQPAGHVGFFLWGHVPEPFTMYRGVRALPAGSSIWVDERGVSRPSAFVELKSLLSRASTSISSAEIDAELHSALVDTVRHHLIADVDVGVFLSAGIDSTVLSALAAEAGGTLRTVTLGFAEFRGTDMDETILAETVARQRGAEHRTIWITRDEFRAELEHLLDRMDQPSIDGVNSYFVAKAAKEAGLKVALSGLGGDELFGGYPSFSQVPALVAAMRRVPHAKIIGRGLRAATAALLGRVSSPKYAGVVEYGNTFGGAYLLRRGLFMPWELPALLDPDLVTAGWQELETMERLEASVEGITSDRLKVSTLEASWYMRNQLLRDTDWATMTHSIEVRVPFVDWELWRRVTPLLSSAPNINKRALARSTRIPLPDAILARPKSGFVVPTRTWMLESSATKAPRGLRGWAQHVYDAAA
jgi:asparagine synthase (glutamine-hydrolysing)